MTEFEVCGSVQEVKDLLYRLQTEAAIRLAELAGRGLEIQGRDLNIAAPSDGWVLIEDWAARRGPFVSFFPRKKDALAALEALAVRHDRAVFQVREEFHVDPTPEGCRESFLLVKPIRGGETA